MLEDYFTLALRNLLHRRLRSFLTILGIFIGIAAVIALISLGDGLQNAIAGEFAKLGTDKITIMATTGGFATSPIASAASSTPITKEDLEEVLNVDGVDQAAGMLMMGAEASFKGQKKSLFATGYALDVTKKLFEDTQSYKLAVGRDMRESDSSKIVIGSYVADGFFKKKVDLGETIYLNNKPFQVVGILESMGNHLDDSQVYLSLDESRELFEQPKRVSLIIASVKPGAVPETVAKKIEDRLRKFRGEDEGSETFSVSTSEQLLASFSSILGVVNALIVGLAAISLLVGGLGIMNTMYTSVLERTKEIGIMKAIGARNRDILSIFLIESALLGLVGGVVGVAIGASLAKIVEYAAENLLGSSLLKVSFNPELILGALLFSTLVGTLSGVLPARQAALLKPVDALRYE